MQPHSRVIEDSIKGLRRLVCEEVVANKLGRGSVWMALCILNTQRVHSNIGNNAVMQNRYSDIDVLNSMGIIKAAFGWPSAF